MVLALGMDALVTFQNESKYLVPCYACFARVLRTLLSTGFSLPCQLPFGDATHYSAPHTPRMGMDALVIFQNDPMYRVLSYAYFAHFALYGVFTSLSTSF